MHAWILPFLINLGMGGSGGPTPAPGSSGRVYVLSASGRVFVLPAAGG
jgi:hypothetical protein